MYPHTHNYSRVLHQFEFKAGKCDFAIPGCLYAQQNGLNKACAQVALRSMISTRLGDPDVSCEKINQYAAEVGSVVPGDGLDTKQISHVLERFGIKHDAIDYHSSPDLKDDFPYEKLVYSGIESGAGALLVFGTSGPEAKPNEAHIVPCYGHTFNEDAWGPQAENAYFRIGETIQYIPSRSWCSSFIAHDDNFGSNLCIPMSLLKSDQVIYAVELLPDGFAYSGAEAEIASADYFYSLLPELPDLMWMVEVTVPEIFSTNKRKLGEILLDAGQELKPEINGESFILARFPESYVFFDEMNEDGNPSFLTVNSALKSHTTLWGSPD